MRLKYALRSLLASPSFTLGSILCLSVGLALTIAAFSLINAVLFRSMPGIRDQHQLRNLWLFANSDYGRQIVSPSSADYEAMRASLSPIAVTAGTEFSVAVRAAGAPIATRAVFAAPNYFDVLGTSAVMGRLFGGSGTDTVVVSERFWRNTLAARPDVIGSALYVNGVSFQISGVVPEKFVGASPGEFEDDADRIPSVWLPLGAFDSVVGSPPSRPFYLRMTVRLAPGVSENEVAARAGAVAASLAAAAGRTGSLVRVHPLHRGAYEDTTDVAIALSVVMAIPLGILAIGCANVANLLLARGATRSREVAVRLALGASRGRVVREFLLESVLLAGGGALVALGLCEVAVRVVASWFPLPLAVDWRVAAFAISAAVATAIAFGLLPALSTTRSAMRSRLQDALPLKTRTRRILVGMQLALSTALLVVSAILVRTVMVVSAPGQDDESRVLAATFGVGLAKYDRVRIDEFDRTLIERITAAPGVEAAGLASVAPFRSSEGLIVSVPGGSSNRRRYAAGGHITDGWLRAAGLRVVAGRDFLSRERQGPPTAALVNETLAAQLWPTGSPLGQSLLVADAERSDGPRHEVQVIGVVSNATRAPGASRPASAFYLPSAITAVRERMLWIRTRGDATDLAALVRSIGSEVAPRVPMTDVITVAGAREREAGPYGWIATGMTTAGMLALLLAAFGMFSLLTYLVAQRNREMGVRLALGARPRDIVRLVVGESAAVAVVGSLAGGAIAVAIGQGLDDLYVGVGSADPLSFLAASGVLIGTVLAASAQPALRAARTDPARVLRAE